MTTQIILSGVPAAVRAFAEFPRRVYFKHLRRALNAAGGVVRKQYSATVPRVTGLLAKTTGVKVAIPDASFNAKHHGKPAYVVIGVKRNASKFLRRNKAGNLRGYGAANKALKAERKNLGVVLSPLQRELEAKRLVQAKFSDATYRAPSRYAHLAGKGRRGADVLNNALRQSQGAALAKMTEKLQQGIATEAAALGPK